MTELVKDSFSLKRPPIGDLIAHTERIIPRAWYGQCLPVIQNSPLKEYYENAHAVQIREYAFTSSDILQQFDGYKIAHLTDLHISDNPLFRGAESLKQLVETLDRYKPDLIVVTGDFIIRYLADVRALEEGLFAFRKLSGLKYATLGNHDLWPGIETAKKIVSLLQNNGFHVLHDDQISISRDDAELIVVGTRDLIADRIDFNQVHHFMKQSSNTIKVLLTHNADWLGINIGQVQEWGSFLSLAGHTHGPQIKNNLIDRACMRYVGYKSEFISGVYPIGEGKILSVDPGFGFHRIPFRSGTESGISMWTLHHGNMS